MTKQTTVVVIGSLRVNIFQVLSMTTSRYLIITADDFGYSSERDDGILACYHDNSISNVSLMVNGYSAEEAVKKAKAIGLPMGIFVCLSQFFC